MNSAVSLYQNQENPQKYLPDHMFPTYNQLFDQFYHHYLHEDSQPIHSKLHTHQTLSEQRIHSTHQIRFNINSQDQPHHPDHYLHPNLWMLTRASEQET